MSQGQQVAPPTNQRVGALQQSPYRERTASCSDATLGHHHHHHHHNHNNSTNLHRNNSTHNSNCSLSSNASSTNSGLENITPPAVQFAINGSRRRAYSCSATAMGAIKKKLASNQSPMKGSEGRRTPPPPTHDGGGNVLSPIPSSPTKDNPMGDICGNIPCRSRTSEITAGCFGAAAEASSSNAGENAGDTCSGGGPVTHAPPPGSGIILQTPQQDATCNETAAGGGKSKPKFFLDEEEEEEDSPQNPLGYEALMSQTHNEILARLNFLLALVDCILELARATGSLISSTRSPSPANSSSNESSRGMAVSAPNPKEQMSLYEKSLYLLNAALTLASSELKAQRLQLSPAVKNVVAELKDKFEITLNKCKNLTQTVGASAVEYEPNTADKLLYQHALDMCQSAALAELFSTPTDCFKQYQTAQILLHALHQQAYNPSDKILLKTYTSMVERRLLLLHEKGVLQVYHSPGAQPQ